MSRAWMPWEDGTSGRRRPWFLRSRRALFLILAAVLVVPVAVFAYVSASIGAEALRSQAVGQSESSAEMVRRLVQTWLDGLAKHLEGAARCPSLLESIERADAPAVRRELRDLVTQDERLDRVLVTDPFGVLKADWPEDPAVAERSFDHRDWYTGVRSSGRTYLSEVYLRAARPRVLLAAMATPVRDGDGEVRGYLVGHVTVDSLVGWASTIHPAGGALALLDRRRALVARPPAGQEDLRVLDPLESPSRGEPWVGPDPETGEESLLCVRSVEPWGWAIQTRVPMRALSGPVHGLQGMLVLLAALLFAVVLALGFPWLASIRAHNLEALRLREEKEHLTATVVHDMRNPLTALIGNIDLATGYAQRLSPEAVTALRQARLSAKRLAEMSNTLIDVIRMEDGRMPVQLGLVDLAEVVRVKASEYAAKARTADIDLRVEAPSDPVRAVADTALLVRVVENLLTNALKHTPPQGAVTLAVAAPEPGRAVLRVQDTGEGIEKEQGSRLFTRYGRASGQRMSRPTDTGLGLVFCRMAVELQGGRIEMQSEPQRGSVFTVHLPGPLEVAARAGAAASGAERAGAPTRPHP